MEGGRKDMGRRGRGGGEREGRRGWGGKRQTVGDLKSKEDILKKRRKKTFQQSRRRLKMKGKSNSGKRTGSRKGQ